MATTPYLQVRAGPMLMLLDAAHVHEVLDTGWREHAHAHAQWRGQVLPVVALARFFGFGDTPSGSGVVYSFGADVSPLLLAVDEVLGLCAVDAHEWKRLPALPEQAAQYFDAALARAGQDLLSCRLRATLDPSCFVMTAE